MKLVPHNYTYSIIESYTIHDHETWLADKETRAIFGCFASQLSQPRAFRGWRLRLRPKSAHLGGTQLSSAIGDLAATCHVRRGCGGFEVSVEKRGDQNDMIDI